MDPLIRHYHLMWKMIVQEAFGIEPSKGDEHVN